MYTGDRKELLLLGFDSIWVLPDVRDSFGSSYHNIRTTGRTILTTNW